MKCDKLKPLIFSIADLAYVDEICVTKNFQNPHDHAVYKATEVDAAIDELKSENQRLSNALDKERRETIKYMDELCNAKNEIERLTIDKRGVELRADIADATIEKLKARIAELEKENESLKYSVATLETDLAMSQRWRKFPDEKPTEDTKFLVINEKGFIQCCYYSPILKEFQIPVTHWMPLPSAPKEEK